MIIASVQAIKMVLLSNLACLPQLNYLFMFQNKNKKAILVLFLRIYFEYKSFR